MGDRWDISSINLEMDIPSGNQTESCPFCHGGTPNHPVVMETNGDDGSNPRFLETSNFLGTQQSVAWWLILMINSWVISLQSSQGCIKGSESQLTSLRSAKFHNLFVRQNDGWWGISSDRKFIDPPRNQHRFSRQVQASKDWTYRELSQALQGKLQAQKQVGDGHSMVNVMAFIVGDGHPT